MILSRHQVPSIARWTTITAGLIDISSVIFRPLNGRLERVSSILPGTPTHLPRVALLITGVAMFVISGGLAKRKRRAWQIALVVIAVSVLVGHEESIFAFVLFLLLVFYRKEFFAASDPTTRWRSLGLFMQFFAISLVIGLILFAARSQLLVGNPSAGGVGLTVLRGLVGLTGPVLFHDDRVQDLTLILLEALGAITIVLPAIAFLKSPAARSSRRIEERADLQRIVKESDDSLAYFALRDDKSIVWSQNRNVAIAYRVVAGAMLATGDPLGPQHLWAQAMKEFKEVADAHAWTIGIMGCSEQASHIWIAACELQAIEMGDEAIVDIKNFSLEGRNMRNIRQMAARAKRNGYSVEISMIENLTDEELKSWKYHAMDWRGEQRERGFSMNLGRYGDRRDGRALLVEAKQNGEMKAFLQLLPWGDHRYSLDIMRRSPHADPGLNELMICEFVSWAALNNISHLSLNFAAFRSVFERGEQSGASPFWRLTRWILLIASRWIQIESLYRFNSKFQPDWETRYLLFPKGGSIVRIGVAMLEAEAFVIWPKLTEPWRWRRLPER